MEDEGEREFRCEEAAAQVEKCCPGVDVAAMYCSRRDEGCDECDPRPVLSLAEATCVRDASCAKLQETGICDRLHALEGVTSCSRGPGQSDEVCR